MFSSHSSLVTFQTVITLATCQTCVHTGRQTHTHTGARTQRRGLQHADEVDVKFPALRSLQVSNPHGGRGRGRLPGAEAGSSTVASPQVPVQE